MNLNSWLDSFAEIVARERVRRWREHAKQEPPAQPAINCLPGADRLVVQE